MTDIDIKKSVKSKTKSVMMMLTSIISISTGMYLIYLPELFKKQEWKGIKNYEGMKKLDMK